MKSVYFGRVATGASFIAWLAWVSEICFSLTLEQPGMSLLHINDYDNLLPWFI